MEERKLNIAVVGGAGSTGGELCRLLLNHPQVDRIFPTSERNLEFEREHRNLLGTGLRFFRKEELRKFDRFFDFVFFCTPSGEAMQEAPFFLEQNSYVIDLSADFRFSNPDDYEKTYGLKHKTPYLLSKAICGITEYFREDIKHAQLVANPGCYAIATVLGLVPLLSSGLVSFSSRLHITAINGTSGAGSKLKKDLHHASCFGSILPYSLNGHRHRLEIERRIESLTNKRVFIDFITAHGNFSRGIVILATIPLEKTQKASRESLCEIYQHHYKNDANSFVQINNFPSQAKVCNEKEYDIYPNVSRVIGSNFCHIGMDYDADSHSAKVVSVIDNLIKGAAGSAIQNMNVILGIDEKTGLKNYGL